MYYYKTLVRIGHVLVFFVHFMKTERTELVPRSKENKPFYMFHLASSTPSIDKIMPSNIVYRQEPGWKNTSNW